mmetsp:Transcript_9292/g.28652  ORF Transcript_9292/g.28652 Transcript_9292/m.28652 type:complete len:365 (-) Transcript_9292:604-1698(-)
MADGDPSGLHGKLLVDAPNLCAAGSLETDLADQQHLRPAGHQAHVEGLVRVVRPSKYIARALDQSEGGQGRLDEWLVHCDDDGGLLATLAGHTVHQEGDQVDLDDVVQCGSNDRGFLIHTHRHDQHRERAHTALRLRLHPHGQDTEVVHGEDGEPPGGVTTDHHQQVGIRGDHGEVILAVGHQDLAETDAFARHTSESQAAITTQSQVSPPEGDEVARRAGRHQARQRLPRYFGAVRLDGGQRAVGKRYPKRFGPTAGEPGSSETHSCDGATRRLTPQPEVGHHRECVAVDHVHEAVRERAGEAPICEYLHSAGGSRVDPVEAFHDALPESQDGALKRQSVQNSVLGACNIHDLHRHAWALDLL